MKMNPLVRILTVACMPLFFNVAAANAATTCTACCDPKVDPKMTPTQFAQTVATVDMLEIKLGEVAQVNSVSSAVKKFGRYMVKSHTEINNKLTDVVAKEGIAIPTKLDPKHQGVLDKLSGLKGDAFDTTYIPAMVAGHTKVLAMVKSFAASTTDPEFKKFATWLTPIIANHLAAATKIRDAMVKSGLLK